MVASKWFNKYATNTQYKTPQIKNLSGNQTLTLKRRGQTIDVKSGCVWVTFDGEDHIIEQGQHVCIGQGKNIAAISSANNQDIHIEIS